ncbi:MAG TPA: hypothetical protein PKI55_12820 [Chitinophagaceae bacterium]|nr:hypothetical protein [Chitinophagaceae bacterium]
MRYLTEKEKSWSDKKLERKVFVFDGSEAHKRFFKNKIVQFLQGEQRQTFSQYMWEAIWECNDCGKYSMYLYFNEHVQKLYIDKYFYEWMTRMIEKINVELEKVSFLNHYWFFYICKSSFR